MSYLPAMPPLPSIPKKYRTPKGVCNGILSWLDDHILLLIAGFLLAFIPLYPKLPLFSPIEQYIVRIRLEDLFVLIAVIVWCVQLLRKKIQWYTPIVWWMVAYLIIGGLSIVSGLFLIQWIPFEPIHIGKSVLHWMRYFQYFTLFFIVYSAVETRRHIQILLSVILLTLAAIAIYAFGQRYYYWPVYTTMNREFSKGVRLYLTENARVNATFAGHYDLAAYIVLTSPIILAWYYLTKRYWLKAILGTVFLALVWTLVVTVSRSSFGAFLVSTGLVVLGVSLRKETWLGAIGSAFGRGIGVLLVIGLVVSYSGDNLYDRFEQMLQPYPAAYETYHSWNGQRKKLLNEQIPTMLGFEDGFEFKRGEKPDNSISTDEATQQVAAKSDAQPSTEKPDQQGDENLPGDVFENIPDQVEVSTTSADGTTTTTTVERERTYSENAWKHGLSLAIRYDTLWPQAIQGLQRNPLVGSGYATLGKADKYTFTIAESTDNNFLRTLGETGLLGFITFYGLIVAAMWYSIRLVLDTPRDDTISTMLGVGFFAGNVGLLINALLIDVYAASKVAFTLWALTGLLMALYRIVTSEEGRETHHFLGWNPALPAVLQRFRKK